MKKLKVCLKHRQSSCSLEVVLVDVQGDYVVLASEPISICGVDVAAPQQLRMRGSQQKMTIAQLKAIFDKQFTPYEVCILLILLLGKFFIAELP